MDANQPHAGETNYEFAIGEFDCAVVSDGSFDYPDPRRLFFVNAEEDQLATALEQHGIESGLGRRT